MHGNEKRISQVFWSTRNKKPMRFLIYASTLMILIWPLVSCWRLLRIKRSVSLTDGPQVAFVQSLTSVCILFCPLLRKRKRFCFAVHLFRNELQRTSPCGKDNTLGCTACATLTFYRIWTLSAIYYWRGSLQIGWWIKDVIQNWMTSIVLIKLKCITLKKSLKLL